MPIDEKERERRRRLVKAHVDAENAHDIERIMSTFSPNAFNTLNDMFAADSATTRLLHELFGFSTTLSVMDELKVVPELERFTDFEIVHYGYLQGRHTGFIPGFPAPTFREVKLPYCAIYRFDDEDLLVSERTKLDTSALYAPPPQSSRGEP